MIWLEGARPFRELVREISLDCEHLLEELHVLYPRFSELQPAQKLEDILLDVCDFHVVDQPLPLGQMALCDFSSSTVFLNSDLSFDCDLKLLRTSVLAHELGHIRLHACEMQDGSLSTNYQPVLGLVANSRSLYQEQEADLYARLFLLPLPKLLADKDVQKMLQKIRKRRTMMSWSLHRLLGRVASRFQVAPYLVRYRFLELGWIEKMETRFRASGSLKLAYDSTWLDH